MNGQDTLDVFAPEPLEWPDRPRVLLSYAYARKVPAERFAEWGEAGVDVILDSGAFTAHNSGRAVDHDDFLDWLADHAEFVTFAFALDVIGDPDASLANWAHASDQLRGVVTLLPTWHIGTPFSVLDDYCAAAEYVAIGGAVPHYQKQNDLYRLSLQAHEVARRHGTRLHGLGMTGRRVMFGLPWASVDSSSWSIPARMPFLYLANPEGRLVSLNYGRPMPEHHKDLVRQYGGDPTGMDVEGFSLTSVVGPELAAERRLWGTTASARSYCYVEAAKRRATGHPFKVYLAAAPDTVDTTIRPAWAMGNPWPDHDEARGVA